MKCKIGIMELSWQPYFLYQLQVAAAPLPQRQRLAFLLVVLLQPPFLKLHQRRQHPPIATHYHTAQQMV